MTLLIQASCCLLLGFYMGTASNLESLKNTAAGMRGESLGREHELPSGQVDGGAGGNEYHFQMGTGDASLCLCLRVGGSPPQPQDTRFLCTTVTAFLSLVLHLFFGKRKWYSDHLREQTNLLLHKESQQTNYNCIPHSTTHFNVEMVNTNIRLLLVI